MLTAVFMEHCFFVLRKKNLKMSNRSVLFVPETRAAKSAIEVGAEG